MRPPECLRELAALLRDEKDMLEGRVQEPAAPRWCEQRGWTGFLLGLDERALERCEHGSLPRAIASLRGAPPSLLELTARVEALTALEETSPAPSQPLRRASERKRAQVAVLSALVRAWAPRARRIVDLGAGHGHLTRELARELGLDAIGLETRVHVVAGARALTDTEHVRFEARDALAAPLALEPDDLVVGLHACGALGDGLVRAAAAAQAGVLLVACCPQKIAETSRAPLSALGASLGLTFAREHLGLANLATLAEGGAGSAAVMERRRTRHALFLALREAGVELTPGDEMSGTHRRQLRRPLEDLAPRIFAARGLPPPSPALLADAAKRAREEHARIRRLALPRALLARPLELALALDRAVSLEEAGGEPPSVRQAFDRAASPRNVALVRAPGPRAG